MSERAPSERAPTPAGRRPRLRTWAPTVLALLVVWTASIAPHRLDQVSLGDLLRIPVEALVLIVLVLVLPPRLGRALAAVVGVLLGLLVVLRILDTGFSQELGRPFDLVGDWASAGPAVGVLRSSIGAAWADAAVAAAVLAVLAVVVGVTWAVLRVGRAALRRRSSSARIVAVLGVSWVACAVLGVSTPPEEAVASRSAIGLAVDHVRDAGARLADRRAFGSALEDEDPYAARPAADLLRGLRGKDVVVAFVESYGRVAVHDSTAAPGVDAVLRAGTLGLRAAGYSARSAYLTSPTFGGISWLAHSTLQSGLWVDSQQRYDQLVASDRLTLSAAFRRAGWRTVGDAPADTGPWPQGTSFYHYDTLYGRDDVGYAGPAFGYASMPDQYTLAAFRRRELAPGHEPVMAEIDLVSSHTPWTPLPRMVRWTDVGDGSVYAGMPAEGLPAQVAWRDPERVRALYGQSVQYSLRSLISFVTTWPDPDLVLVLVGDHQPATIVSGPDANRDVPITIVAHGTAVTDRIASWHWQDGMLPDRRAPVWRMDAFRDRFLDAFGARP